MDQPRLSPEAINTAMKSPEHLKLWLEKSGRRWLVLNGLDLVDALPWPSGVEAFVQIVMAYRDHRATIDTGRVEEIDVEGTKRRVPVMKGELLEVEELDRAIRYLIGEITRRDPTWDVNKPGM